MSAAAYVVIDGAMLCYVDPRQPTAAGVLASRKLSWDLMAGPYYVPADPRRLRPATAADFERFRVSPAGHLP